MSNYKSVVGINTGDGECWSLKVTPEEYRKVCGEEDYKLEEYFRIQTKKECLKQGIPYHEEPWRLYPSDLIGFCGEDKHQEQKIRITLSVEVIND